MALARIVLSVLIVAAICGAIYFIAHSRLSLAAALVPVIVWGVVLLLYAPNIPFFAASRPALLFSATLFGLTSAFFLVLCINVSYHELPRTVAPRFDATVIAPAHPSERTISEVQFEDENGKLRTLALAAGEAKSLQPGDHVQLTLYGGRYLLPRHNEAQIFWFLIGVLGSCFLVSGSVAFISVTRYLNVKT